MLGDIKRDMQQERPYMLNADSTSRADAGQPPPNAGLLSRSAPPAAAAAAPASPGMAPAPGMDAWLPALPGMATGDPLSGGPEGDPSGAGPEANASPEEQEQYDRLMMMFMQYIHGTGAETVEQRLRAQPDNVPEAIGDIVSGLGKAFATQAQAAGETLDDGVMMHAATEAVEQLSEVAEASGVVEQMGEPEMEAALYAALSSYGNDLLQSGEQPPGDNAAIAQGLDHLGAQNGAQNGAQGAVAP